MKSKNYITGALIAAICIMAIGYAALAQTLTINGTATITGSWDVHLENVQAGAKTATATVVGTPTITGTTALEFNVELQQPGDSITYTVDVKNAGTIDAKLVNITTNQTGDASDVNWTFSGIAKDDVVAAGQTKTVTMTATFDSSATTVTKDQVKHLAVVMDFGQNN